MIHLIVSRNGEITFFNSSRKSEHEQSDSVIDYLEDVYKSDINIYYMLNGDTLDIPQLLEGGINTTQDDAIIFLSRTGSKLYCISFKDGFEMDGGPIYSASLNDVSVSSVEGLGSGLTEFFSESDHRIYFINNEIICGKYIAGASISNDETELYFSKDVNNQYGKFDIWVSRLVNGDWSYPMNLGESIIFPNVVNKEPFISKDKNTLYFSSNNHNSFGGYDIYYSQNLNNQWQKPVNMGPNINSEFDENQIIISKTDDHTFITINTHLQDQTHNDIFVLDRDEDSHNDPKFSEIEELVSSNNSTIDSDIFVQIYPNPIMDILNIKLNSEEHLNGLSVEIVNVITTREVYSQKVENRQDCEMKINVSHWVSGVYLLIVKDNTEIIQIFKIIKI